MQRFILIVSLCFMSTSIQAAENPWVLMTQQDLQGIHDILQENHPGPVDPENHRYAQWLKDGLNLATTRAESASSFSDYVRTLRHYTNGFQDGHIGIALEVHPDDIVWPGFIIDQDFNGQPVVVAAEEDSGVSKDTKILACDGQTIDALMSDRVDPYFWNSAIPHERYRNLSRLFYQDAQDSKRFQACTFSTGEVKLKWRREDRNDFQKRIDSVHGSSSREPEMKQVGEVWIISVPTLAYSGEEKVKKIRNLISEINTHQSELRNSEVVFDVRGNHGGDSGWGEELAAALWGREWVDWVTSDFDNTVDWRASKSNYTFMQSMVEREKKAGLADQLAYVTKVRDAMKAALDSGTALARVEERPKKKEGSAPLNPIKGKIYFFTDGECASACLDFADVMRHLPNVVHVGLPTSADAIYIDNTYTMLPSGLAGLGYSMKVFRNRVRGNNEWYEPQIRWPGGMMTDESIAKWIRSLK